MRATATFIWVFAFIALSGCSAQHGLGGAERKTAPATPAAADAPASAQSEANAAHGAEARVILTPASGAPVSVQVEVARTEAQRQRGLMFRTKMDEDAGMIFLFDKPDQLTFWMHNTYIPLDMVFIEPSMRILGIVDNVPPRNDSPRAVPGKSQYVLELNAGFCERHGITPGATVKFEGVGALPTAGDSQ